ncbi:MULTISPECIES: hypothetical protein [Methylosinus]|uniref:Uncharacterized protein n=1 Tax=Methylosinus trichosporium (strain ATCC 35070 / NCIMB 11131 / UNIQEM 75 / OB3b) TaxID=595536 RepID=A0A2D2D0A0_METT3|nr:MULTISPECIES: hypothetical protein [Methylosinus]ATQ68418.1 hypothetical protein CQW49_11385 [Methylosinus trichosporium OB3b]OBS51344.1 hypothetical protein A8B73_16820 [Methylosinus sp. 3S-1]
MSWSASDEDISVYESGPARARPLGSLAASSMGLTASLVLVGAALFLGPVAPPQVDDLPTATIAPRPNAPVRAEAPAPVAPKAAFDLDVPELAKEKSVSVEPARQAGGRQESMSFGGFDAGRFFLRVDILQPAGAKLGNSDFFLDMARHAAEAGLAVVRISQPTPLAGRAGAFEAADIRLSQRQGDGPATERSCAAVRMIDSTLSIEIAGLACGAPGHPVDRRVATCLLDRLYYLPGGKNEALQKAFAKVDAPSCFAAPTTEANAAAARPAKKRGARH